MSSFPLKRHAAMSETTFTRMSLEEIRKLKGKTDGERLKRDEPAGTEPEPENGELELDWSKARLVTPQPKKPVSIRLDPDVLAFFKSQGKGYQTRINAVLRAYMNYMKTQERCKTDQ